MVNNSSANAGDAGDAGLIPGSGRSPGGGHGHPLQYSNLENSHGQRSLAGCSPWGCKRVRHDLATNDDHTVRILPDICSMFFCLQSVWSGFDFRK